MENLPTTTPPRPASSFLKKNILAIIGFLLVIAGPAIMMIAGAVQSHTGNFSVHAATAIAAIAAILPAAGFVIGIIALCLWNRTGIVSRILSIVTLVLCNPFFYLTYLFMALAQIRTLAGLPFMGGPVPPA